MSFIAELNESRLFKRLSQIKGESVQGLSIRLFLHLLALQILAHLDIKQARSYASDVANRGQFDEFRASQPDLYNLIVLVSNLDKYKDLISGSSSIFIPEFRLKRVLRELSSGNLDNHDYSQLMMMLQRNIDGLNSLHLSLRRSAGDWKSLSTLEKTNTLRTLVRELQEHSFNSDLYLLLKKFATV